MLPEVLREVEQQPILSVSRLSERLGVNKPVLGDLIRSLVRREYLNREKVFPTPEECQNQACPLDGMCPVERPSERGDHGRQLTSYSLTSKGEKLLSDRKRVSDHAGS